MKIFYEASKTPQAQQELKRLKKLHPQVTKAKAEVIVVIGGDGFMLKTLHKYYGTDKLIYGLNFGTVGFMMNAPKGDLIKSIKKSNKHILRPLLLTATLKNAKEKQIIGFNEASIHRQTAQAIQLSVDVNGKRRLDELVCDGAIVATPSGSTAYNFSAGGSILPMDSNALALTPISPFRPRRWNGAIIPDTTEVSFTVLNSEKRPAYVTADNKSIENVIDVNVRQVKKGITILTDANHDLEERIISEQFN